MVYVPINYLLFLQMPGNSVLQVSLSASRVIIISGWENIACEPLGGYAEIFPRYHLQKINARSEVN
jgi:hypothetical protein